MIELVLRLGLSLAIVLGLFWAIARTSSKRMGGTRSLMKVTSRQSLTRSSSVAVVEVGNRMLVIGVSDGGVRLLTELDPEEVAETAPAAAKVAQGRRATVGRRAARPAARAGARKAAPAARRTPAGKRRAGVPTAPVAAPVLATETAPAVEVVEELREEVTLVQRVPAAPAPAFAAILAEAQAAQAPVEPALPAVLPAPVAVPVRRPAPTLPDELVAAMPAALVAIAEAELAQARPTVVTQVATQVATQAGKRRAVAAAPVPALAGTAPSASPIAGSILAPDTWKSAWRAVSSQGRA